MDQGHSSRQPQFRDSYTWKSVPYNQNSSVKSKHFKLSSNIEVTCCLSAYRFQNPIVTVLHVQVEKICSLMPYGAADITITLSDGCSKTEEIRDWFKDSSVFCFSNRAGGNQWRPDIKCEIAWYGFISKEEWKNVLNKKKVLPLDELLCSDNGKDVTLIVQNRIIRAHKCILQYYSPIFCATFKEAGDAGRNIVLRLPEFEFETIKEVLRFMYIGNFQIDDFSTWLRALRVAKVYKIDKIEKYCETNVLRFFKQGNMSANSMLNSRRII